MAGENREIADLIVSSAGYKLTVGPTDRAKVTAEAKGQRRPMPAARLAQAAVRNYRLDPPPPPAPSGVGLLARNFAFYRNPRGGVENVNAAKQAGLGLAFLNIGDHQPEEWATLTAKLDTAGIAWGYWAHCRTVPQLQALLNRSREHARPVVGLNVEAELSTVLPPAVIRREVIQSGYQGQVTTVLYGWVQNNTDCVPIGDWVAILEVFPQDAPSLWPPFEKVDDCLHHARQLGLKLPVPAYGTYPDPELGPAMPAWYDRTIHHGLYTVDDTAERWDRWGWNR